MHFSNTFYSHRVVTRVCTRTYVCVLAAGTRAGSGTAAESLTRPEIDGYWKRFVAREQEAAAARGSRSMSGSRSGSGSESGGGGGLDDDERLDVDGDQDVDEGFTERRRKRRAAHKSKMEQVVLSYPISSLLLSYPVSSHLAARVSFSGCSRSYGFDFRTAQAIFARVLQQHRAGIVRPQVAAGRSFEGPSFQSKPRVIHFKARYTQNIYYICSNIRYIQVSNVLVCREGFRGGPHVREADSDNECVLHDQRAEARGPHLEAQGLH